MRSFWTIWGGGLKSNEKCPYKRHTEERRTEGRERNAKMKAEIGVMQP